MYHKVVQITVLRVVQEVAALRTIRENTGGKKGEQKPRVLLRGSLTSLEKTDRMCNFPRFSAGRKGKGFWRVSSAFVCTDGRRKQTHACRKNKVSSREGRNDEPVVGKGGVHTQGEGLALETRRCHIWKKWLKKHSKSQEMSYSIERWR